MLELRLFGTGRASYGKRPLVGFPSQQSFLLLCYLLLNPHFHHRERLAAVFWSDVSSLASRKNLSQALWRLRQALQVAQVPVDDYLIVEGDNVSFNHTSAHWLDIAVFEETVTRYQAMTGDKLSPEQARELEEAVSLCTGDLLEGIYEDWCLYDRERLGILYLEALGKLVLFHECNKTYQQGLVYGERILSYDSTRERAHQQMMRLYWLMDNRSEALAQYKRCLQILRDELNVAPMPETTQLYEQMLHHQFQPENNLSYRQGNVLSPLIRADELQELAEQSLQKLFTLQKIMDQTSAELRSLERLIRTTLLRSEEP